MQRIGSGRVIGRIDQIGSRAVDRIGSRNQSNRSIKSGHVQQIGSGREIGRIDQIGSQNQSNRSIKSGHVQQIGSGREIGRIDQIGSRNQSNRLNQVACSGSDRVAKSIESIKLGREISRID